MEMTLFDRDWAASFQAWSMLRLADTDAWRTQINTDIRTADRFMDLMASYPDGKSERIKAFLLYARLTGDTTFQERAEAIGDTLVRNCAPGSYLSHNLEQIDAFLALYEITPDPDYLSLSERLFDHIQTNLVIDDPLHPGFKIVAHDVGIADRVKAGTWPPASWDPDYMGAKFPACTGCNHMLCELIHKYDRLKNR
ncbi:MAG: hypothetical protein SWH68_09950 [Thermodesulfobacteriota bacterium]|nr:hypothetical protein [Thermodesulfobacteriota bacterium]